MSTEIKKKKSGIKDVSALRINVMIKKTTTHDRVSNVADVSNQPPNNVSSFLLMLVSQLIQSRHV